MLEADLRRLRSIDGIKWTKYGPDVLPAWVADMDFDPAPEIKDAIRAVLDLGDLGYNFAAVDALLPTWADWQQHHHGWRPPEDECWAFTGVLHGLEVAMVLPTEPNDGVVVFSPIYQPFRAAIEQSGRRVIDVPLDGPEWRLDPERFEAALDPTTRVVLFCQPHNPLGRVFDHDELHAFADVVDRHDLLVISDEIWADLTHEPHQHVPLATADERLLPRLMTLGSASKTFNLAGLRCAVAHVGSAALRRQLSTFPSHCLGSPSTVSAAATVAAWTKAHGWYEEVAATLTANRDHLARRVADDLPGVRMERPQATYLAWLDFAGTALDTDPSKHLLDRAGIALDRGRKFGPQAEANARINFATSREILDTIVDRTAETLEETDR